MTRRGASGRAVLATLSLLLLFPRNDADAIEAFDGRVQIHGALEMQVRTLSKNFSADQGWDLAQWYNVINVETELDIAPDGWGPFSHVSGFIRAEARYDCVWSHGCGMFPSVDTYGNEAERLPEHLSNGRRDTEVGVIRPSRVNVGGGELRDYTDRRRYISTPVGQNGSLYGIASSPLQRSVPGRGYVGRIWNAPLVSQLFFGLPGLDPNAFSPVDGTPFVDVGLADDDLRRYPGTYVAQNYLDYRWGARQSLGGGLTSLELLGPWRPIDRIPAYAALHDRVNPYADCCTRNPTSQNVPRLPLSTVDGIPVMVAGVNELAFRPAPVSQANDPFARDIAQGLYYPSAGLRQFFEDGGDLYDQNFSQTDLAWNHGGSQGDEQELKEAYLDVEMFDSRLWMRLGRQVIVWGKTELFRAVDQFNPQDLGLASLPTLEESRIPLWAARAMVSFGDVGPLEDVRLEGAVLLDQYEPADIGRCGEPYSPIVSCLLSAGLFAHATVGTGLAGMIRPDDPWESAKGLEGGVRLEFRWGRFSFALSDYYGFDDLPYIEELQEYERNVDPTTGRPRKVFTRGVCTTGLEQDCLGTQPTRLDGPTPGTRMLNPLVRQDVLLNHASNQQMFATICAATAGVSETNPGACGFNLWNSPDAVAPNQGVNVPTSSAFGTLLSGGVSPIFPALANARIVMLSLGRFFATPAAAMPVVTLRRGPGDGGANTPGQYRDIFGPPDPGDALRASGASPYLNDAQEGLIGCGRFYANPCDITGFDLFNAEASALFQSWPGFEGTDGYDWDTFVGTQPGTRNFVGGPVCSRFEDGRPYTLPGCEHDDPAIDLTSPLRHPFFGGARNGCLPVCSDPNDQFFVSEMAALSFNALMTFAASSQPPDVITNASGLVGSDQISDRTPYLNEFDPTNPYRTDGCSWRKPFLCRNVAAFLATTVAQRATVQARGNPRFGRRDFIWQAGSVVALRYQKRNVLGLSLDFAEDYTKTAWSMEFSWIEDVQTADLDRPDGIKDTDQLNLVFSIDRPTFVNFLNPNRTLFFNTQVFIRYIAGYEKSMPINGPVNVLSTFTVATGYFQDRLVPAFTVVHDFQSTSGGALFSVGYRYTERFSITAGVAAFYGRTQTRLKQPDRVHVQNGLTLIRDRDELYLRLRYTF